MAIVPQEEQEVKPEDDEYIFGDLPKECAVDWCHEPVHDHGLCFDHFVDEENARWDDAQAERATCLAGVGYR